jgi:peroxiredoxin
LFVMRTTTVFVAVFGLALAACGESGKSTAREAAGMGKAAPAFQAKTLDGEYVQLADFEGRVVLLNVWATWCEPCKKELPTLVSLDQKYRDQGLTVLGVSTDVPSNYGTLRAMVAQHGIAYPIVLDPNGREIAGYGVRGYPTTFVIDREGNLRWRRDGIIRDNDGELAAQLEAAL